MKRNAYQHAFVGASLATATRLAKRFELARVVGALPTAHWTLLFLGAHFMLTKNASPRGHELDLRGNDTR